MLELKEIRKCLRIAILTVMVLQVGVAAHAQVDFNKQYFNAKALFREGKYNLAMESFKPLIAYDKANKFSEYASFYYALSAYNMSYRAVAKDMFVQLKSLHPTWDKMDEVNFWLAKIHFENKDYFQGLKVLSAVQAKGLQKEAEALKALSLASITDVETLRMMYEEYPTDRVVARSLATILSKKLTDPQALAQVELIIQKFNFKRTDFIPEAPITFRKDEYTVSALLPLMAATLDPTPTRKRNQVVLDLYEGMKLAVDTLNKQGIKISFRAYDTERNAEKIKRLLGTEELKNTDLIVGPFFQDENKVIQDFSLNQKVNIFNPLANNSETIGINPYAFLFQPSFETLGKKSAEFLAGYVKRKNCIVFYGNTKSDSIQAANFIQQAGVQGFKISAVHKVNRDANKIITILATPTEFDEFKYAKEFTLKKDSLGSIFVASDDPMVYAKVTSAIETRGDSVVLLGSENWLADNAIDLDKYETLGIVLAAPRHASPSNAHYKTFERKFIRIHGRAPTTTSRIGYEMMLFLGHQLKNNGVYFQDGLSRAGFMPGFLSTGYQYGTARDNQVVPFITFRNGEPVVLNNK
ncbi:MAG: ABC transporter substrate-binding protein [Cyclobacteriaceae bacterium]|nr:ABC transporter substrate-binding protein [Cyclobacteriaceae bacterium]